MKEKLRDLANNIYIKTKTIKIFALKRCGELYNKWINQEK